MFIIRALYQTCKGSYSLEISLCGYQHLLTIPKIWGSAEQKPHGDPPDPFFRRHQTKAVWGRD